MVVQDRRGDGHAIDAFLLKTPVFGILIRKVAVAKFTRTLGTLISSGVAILDGLDITARTAGNKIVEMAVLRTRASISRRQDDRGAAAGDPGSSRPWSCR